MHAGIPIICVRLALRSEAVVAEASVRAAANASRGGAGAVSTAVEGVGRRAEVWASRITAIANSTVTPAAMRASTRHRAPAADGSTGSADRSDPL